MPLQDSNALFVGFLSLLLRLNLIAHAYSRIMWTKLAPHTVIYYCTNNIYDCMAPHNILRRFSRHEHAHDRSTSIYVYMHVKIYKPSYIYIYLYTYLYVYIFFFIYIESNYKRNEVNYSFYIWNIEVWAYIHRYLSTFFYYCCCCLPRQCRTWPAKRERKKTNQEKNMYVSTYLLHHFPYSFDFLLLRKQINQQNKWFENFKNNNKSIESVFTIGII